MAKAKVKSTARQRDGEYGIMGDMESKKALVANEIGVHQTSVGTNEGGLFDVHVQSIEGIGGEITIVLVLSIYDYDEVFDLVERAFNAAWNYRKKDSNADANAATINWYNSHQEWRRLSPVGSMERWVKE